MLVLRGGCSLRSAQLNSQIQGGPQSGGDFGDEIGRQRDKCLRTRLEKRQFRGVLCQREAELVRCGVVESPLDQNRARTSLCKPPSAGASPNQDSMEIPVYMGASDWTRALSALDRIIMLEPRALDELVERGGLFERLECFKPALEDFQSFLSQAPEHPAAESAREAVLRLIRQVALIN